MFCSIAVCAYINVPIYGIGRTELGKARKKQQHTLLTCECLFKVIHKLILAKVDFEKKNSFDENGQRLLSNANEREEMYKFQIVI